MFKNQVNIPYFWLLILHHCNSEKLFVIEQSVKLFFFIIIIPLNFQY